jgi:hypothetical protein
MSRGGGSYEALDNGCSRDCARGDASGLCCRARRGRSRRTIAGTVQDALGRPLATLSSLIRRACAMIGWVRGCAVRHLNAEMAVHRSKKGRVENPVRASSHRSIDANSSASIFAMSLLIGVLCTAFVTVNIALIISVVSFVGLSFWLVICRFLADQRIILQQLHRSLEKRAFSQETVSPGVLAAQQLEQRYRGY